MSISVRRTNVAGITLEISGTEGDLVMISKDRTMFQIASFIVKGAQGKSAELEQLTIPSEYYWVPSKLIESSPSFNIAQLYSNFHKDIVESTHKTPDFNTGVKLHNLLETIERAAETGTRLKF